MSGRRLVLSLGRSRPNPHSYCPCKLSDSHRKCANSAAVFVLTGTRALKGPAILDRGIARRASERFFHGQINLSWFLLGQQCLSTEACLPCDEAAFTGPCDFGQQDALERTAALEDISRPSIAERNDSKQDRHNGSKLGRSRKDSGNPNSNENGDEIGKVDIRKAGDARDEASAVLAQALPLSDTEPRRNGVQCDNATSTHTRKCSKVKHEQKIDLSDSEQVFQALMASKQSGNMPKSDRDALIEVFNHFNDAGWSLEQASSRCYISSIVFPAAASRFRKFFLNRCTPDVRVHVLELGPSDQADQFLFPLFSQFCTMEFPVEIARYKALVETADLTKPHTWFPFARAIKRKIIYHAGPTNSGKTYNALKRFKEASTGIYCSPLRLLAMEVYDSVNADGVYCSLYTGQEKKEVPFSNHIACTVEMVLTTKSWEVAVIDEIQMLNDDFRGWAWTRALLGLQADEIHLCGDPSVLGLVRDMCAVTGDEMEEFFYDRFEPLSVHHQSLEGNYKNIQPGDCIVSFSRKEIFTIKRAVEQATSNHCCVVYGALPPETRTHQAKLFNDPNSGYDVLVATDAVGMGLNLNIRRIIFYTLEKYNGEMLKKVPPSQVKQIAGRAGRRGSLYQVGSVTTFYSRDIPYLIQCLEEPFVESCSAGLFPMSEQMELFATNLPEATFSKLLDRFAETCRVDGLYFLCRNDNLKKVACIVDKVKGLTLEEKLKFIFAPVNTRDPKVMGALLNFALACSQKLPIHLVMMTPSGSARNDLQLMDLEARHQVLSLYLWLSNHFPEEYFPQKEHAEQMAAEIALLLGESLSQTDIRIVPRERYRVGPDRNVPSS